MPNIEYGDKNIPISKRLLKKMVDSYRNEIGANLLLMNLCGYSNDEEERELKDFIKISRQIINDKRDYSILLKLVKVGQHEKNKFMKKNSEKLSKFFNIESMLEDV